ncbi:hypothetical protein [Aphanothece hegewaldii]|nr:hypothetical protein [Aphanothece hegewaldii]
MLIYTNEEVVSQDFVIDAKAGIKLNYNFFNESNGRQRSLNDVNRLFSKV